MKSRNTKNFMNALFNTLVMTGNYFITKDSKGKKWVLLCSMREDENGGEIITHTFSKCTSMRDFIVSTIIDNPEIQNYDVKLFNSKFCKISKYCFENLIKMCEKHDRIVNCSRAV